jgi:hypothetical protein
MSGNGNPKAITAPASTPDRVPVDVEVVMNTIRRLVVLLAGVVGLLAVAETAAHAGLSGTNHCEPLRRR